MMTIIQMIRRVIGRDAQEMTPPPISDDPFCPRYCGVKEGALFRLAPIDPRTPEETAECEERAWIDDAMLDDEISAECAAEIGSSPVAQM